MKNIIIAALTAVALAFTLPQAVRTAGFTTGGGGLTSPVGVADGGTGATSLTDGGVLLGSGTGAITPMAVLADGEFVVGDGSGDPVAESGETARLSLGLSSIDTATIDTFTVSTAITVPANSISDDELDEGATFEWTGIHTNSATPCFLARNTTTDADVTGNGTAATVDFDNETFDQGSNFASDTFTAPVTGRYLLQASVRVTGITIAADQLFIDLVTSNQTYRNIWADTDDMPADTPLLIIAVADMDASDTVTVAVTGAGESSDVMDIHGDTFPLTYFSGCLLS